MKEFINTLDEYYDSITTRLCAGETMSQELETSFRFTKNQIAELESLRQQNLEQAELTVALQAQIERLTGEARHYIAKSDDLDKHCDELQKEINEQNKQLAAKDEWIAKASEMPVEALSITPAQALEQFAEKVRNQALEDAAELVLNAGYKSNGISAYENIAAAIRREMTKEMK